MKALSLIQPWAWLVVHGGKDIENRVWNTHLRGEFLIHASKGMTAADFEVAWQMARRISQNLAWKLLDARNGALPGAVISRGGIVGVAELVDVLAPTDTPTVPWHVAGQFGFRLRNVRPLPFLPCSGLQRWWGNFELRDGEAVQL
jgi:hypothetical protein